MQHHQAKQQEILEIFYPRKSWGFCCGLFSLAKILNNPQVIHTLCIFMWTT